MLKTLLAFLLIAMAQISVAQALPCSAIEIPNTDTCIVVSHSEIGNTGSGFVPNCGNFIGGDVWYHTTVPASGYIQIEGVITSTLNPDMDMAIYTGQACNTLSLYDCDDLSGGGYMPLIEVANLPAGTDLWIQMWEYGNNNSVIFDLCVSTDEQIATSVSNGYLCENATPFCTDSNYVFPNTVGTVSQAGYEYGCLFTQPNPIWYYFEVENPGDMTIEVSQVSSSTGAGIDVDFITYGPFTDIETACWSGLDTGDVVDCSYSINSTEIINYTNLQVGEFYLILITNYSNQSGTISFSQTSGVASSSCDNVTNCPIGFEQTSPCPSGSNGEIIATSFGVAPYDFYWMDSAGDTLQVSLGLTDSDTLENIPAGEYFVSVSNDDGCAYVTSTVLPPYVESYFNYTDTLLCSTQNSYFPDSLASPGGVFSVTPTGLSIDPITGEINPSTATIGADYEIRYISNGTCGLDTSYYSVSFTDSVTPSYFAYDTTVFCFNGLSAAVTSITSPGSLTFYSPDAGISVNSVNGTIDFSETYVGVYEVYGYTSYGCLDTTMHTITVQGKDTSYFSYPLDTVCQSYLTAIPDSIYAPGGEFLSGAIDIDTLSGLIDLTSGTPGSNILISYTTNGYCSSTSYSVFHLNELRSHFTYPDTIGCTNSNNLVPDYIRDPIGTFYCLDANLVWDDITGEIDVQSTPSGIYQIVRVVSDTCYDSTVVNVHIQNPLSPGFSYSINPICGNETAQVPIIDAPGGIFSSTSGLTINTSTGAITPLSSTAGVYDVQYISPGVCPDTSVISVEILAYTSAYFEFSYAEYCSSLGSVLPSLIQNSGGTFTASGGLIINSTTGEIDLTSVGAGTYTVTYTIPGTCPDVQTLNLTIDPASCFCPANAGTFTLTLNGDSNFENYLCYGDQLEVLTNGDYVMPTQLTDTTVPYNPGVMLLQYSCPPTLNAPDYITDDPCFMGVASVATYNWYINNNLGDNSTYYFVPITMYDTVSLTYSFVNGNEGPCYDIGDPIAVTFLGKIEAQNIPDCVNGESEVMVSGGMPGFDNSLYTISNYAPAHLTLNWSSDDTLNVSDIEVGDELSFLFKDSLGCMLDTTFYNDIQLDTVTLLDVSCEDECDGVIELISSSASLYGFDINSLSADSVFTDLCLGAYEILVLDDQGCGRKYNFQIENGNTGNCAMVFYSGFTPNGDFTNDYWIIEGLPIGEDVSVSIVNRWGDLVWESPSYDNLSSVWGGRNKNGEDLPEGVYFYIVEISGSVYKGFIELSR